MKIYTTPHKLYLNNNLNNIYATFAARTLRNTFIIQRHIVFIKKKKHHLLFAIAS